MDIAALLPLFTALPLVLGGVLVVGHRFQLLQDIVLFATLTGSIAAPPRCSHWFLTGKPSLTTLVCGALDIRSHSWPICSLC